MPASPAPSSSSPSASQASASSASVATTFVSSTRSLSTTGPSGSLIASSDTASPSRSAGSALASTSTSVASAAWTGASSSASLLSSTFGDYSSAASSSYVASASHSSSHASSSSFSAVGSHTSSTTSLPQWTQSVNSLPASSSKAVSSSATSGIVPLVTSASTPSTAYFSTSVSTFGDGPTISAGQSASATTLSAAVSTESKHERNTLLVAILVPILVVLLVVVPCLILIVRLRRRKQARFMPHYDLAPNPPEPPFSAHKPYADSVATSGSHYSMASAPISMAHSEFLQQDLEVQMPTLPPRVPFPDFADRDDVRAPLFVETDVPRALASREGSTTGSPTGSTQSRWAFSPTASIVESLHRVRSKLSTRSAASTHPPPPAPVLDPLAPRLFADPTHIRPAGNDVDWSMDDDPFANLSAPEEGREHGAGPDAREAPGHAYTSLLRKLTHRS